MGQCAFYQCTALEEVVLNNKLKTIKKAGFEKCTALSNVVLENALERIGESAFSGCINLKGHLELPNTVLEIGAYAFNECASLEGLTLSEKLTKIESYTFYGCSNLKGSLRIPDKVIEIGEGAFSKCCSFENLILGVDVRYIQSSAFSRCSGLKELKLNSRLREIGDYAFAHCGNISGCLSIPKTVEDVGRSAFSNCDSLTEVIVEGNTDGTSILPRAFLSCDLLEKVTLENVTSIGESAFENCSKLVNIELGDFNRITQEMFSGCKILSSVGMNKVTVIEKEAFKGCTGLTSMVDLENVNQIGEGAFRDCTGLAEFTIPDKVTSIGAYAFGNCSNVESLVFGSSVSDWGIYAYKKELPFYGMSGVKTIVFKNSEIRDSDFSGPERDIFGSMDKLETIYVPKNCIEKYETTYKGYARNAKFIELDCERDGIDHVWMDSIVEKEPSCTENGVKKQTCKQCGEVKTEDIAALGHTMSEWIVVKEASYSEDGEEERSCSTCAEFTETRVIQKYVLEDMKLNKTDVTLAEGEMVLLSVTCLPINPGEEEISWNSKAEKIATVNSKGEVTAISEGIAIITATFNEVSVECKVTVTSGKWIQNNVGWWYQNADHTYPYNCWKKITGNWYYFNKSGYRVSGWLLSGGIWYYLNPETGIMIEDEWVGNYYMQSSGAMATGWLLIDGDYYYFRSDGQKASHCWIGSYYLKADGKMAANEWVDNGLYYVDANGRYVSKAGWLFIDGKWYFLGNGGMKQTGWILSGAWYYADPDNNGALVEENWKMIGTVEYYFRKGGSMATGWLLLNGEYYYLEASGAKATNKWVGNYYVKDDGVMAKSEWVDGDRYYVDENGLWDSDAVK